MSFGAESLSSSFRRKPESSVVLFRGTTRARNWIPAFAGMTAFFFLTLHAALAAQEPATRIIDNFENPALWTALHTDDVAATLQSAPGKFGKALHLDFDFTDQHGNPINGYATARRELPLDFSGNYELSFWIRGEAGVNTLQFKLVDASGENVWWMNAPDFAFPHEWQQIRIRKRQVEFAWGPSKDHELRHSASIEFVVSSGRDGGKGSVEFDDLSIRPLPPQDDSPLTPVRVSASSALPGAPASAAIDGNAATSWRSDPAKGAEQRFYIDLGKPREFSGIIAHWRHGGRPTSWQVEQSLDAKSWHACAGIVARYADDISEELCDSEARYLRLELYRGEGSSYGLNEIEIKEPGWAATRNAFLQNVAKTAPRGTYPRGFIEQPYWTVIGVDGGAAPALISEDGAIEPQKGGWSIEPFVLVEGRRYSWADVTSTQSLLDGYLPMPSVRWSGAPVQLDVQAFARGTPEAAQLVVRYRVTNTTDKPVEATLQLALRPFQVNPPAQFLNSPGGSADIRSLRWDGGALQVQDSSVWPLTRPDDVTLLDDDGRASTMPEAADGSRSDYDQFGRLCGALVYRLQLAARAAQDIALVTPITGAGGQPRVDAGDANAWFEHERDAVAAGWRSKLDRVQLKLPPQAERLADSLRTAHAHMLISRDAAALRPGTRSYARSWIRDGAMIADALLRLGDLGVAREYVDWYAPHQFANGKVPCCVDHRGADPVPENDSHGELVHAIAQLYRYGGDRAELRKNWPHVAAAIAYMDGLRAGETQRVATGAADASFKGLLPASISHEGYSAKPMHSYWDDSWGLTGYKDAAEMAQALGDGAAAERIAQGRDEFRGDITASIAASVRTHAIDYLPGCAELGDFDATSATIMLSPGGEQLRLPQDLLRGTFDRYWREFSARADGSRAWQDYTPYEWRTVGAFVRLGQRERAQGAIDFFYATGARPPGWNQWAEVVDRDVRKPRFIGDMPHAWVASDFARSTLDLFAYERDGALVLAGGVPNDWLDGDGIEVQRLRTPYGELTYSLKHDGKRTLLHVEGAKPPGGFVLAAPTQADTPHSLRVNGKRVEFKGGEVHIAAEPADVVLE